jgi:hypothetical protein
LGKYNYPLILDITYIDVVGAEEIRSVIIRALV